jgi:glutamate-1-semialdehyde 2,1-aminomutase
LRLCDDNDILLIFDEVMTGFRLARGGVQELLNVDADIICFGKVIGGGLPVGGSSCRNNGLSCSNRACGRTLSGNPLAMAAGLTMLQTLNNDPAILTDA